MTAREKRGRAVLTTLLGVFAVTLSGHAAEGPNLPQARIQQQQIVDGDVDLTDIRLAGLRMFTTPFNRFDGYGDGPIDPADTTSPGGRPTLQGNGTFLRVNGLDAQACLECHTQVSAATSPPTLGIGGVGGSNSNAIIMPTEIDPDDFPVTDGEAEFNGRYANPPFLFGSGGVELLGLEMTGDLQALKQAALANPGVVFELDTKGVSFGSIVADASGELDLSNVEGVDDDLVVRPFGRKGEFASVREFDITAMRFHFGMEPVEFVGQDVDGDGDGVVNEITVGDLSALSIFAVTMDRPAMQRLSPSAARGLNSFRTIGCASCHIPSLQTDRTELPMRFPEVPERPFDNEYYRVDLTRAPADFDSNGRGGLVVPLFADLKRHDMGPDLAESFARVDEATNREFTTARLWGIADTAPYLHDGRATTLTDAILMHGGEAQPVRDAFAALAEADQDDLINFLRSLRTPQEPLKQLLHRARQGSGPGTATREEAVELLRSVRPTPPPANGTVRRVRQEDP